MPIMESTASRDLQKGVGLVSVIKQALREVIRDRLPMSSHCGTGVLTEDALVSEIRLHRSSTAKPSVRFVFKLADGNTCTTAYEDEILIANYAKLRGAVRRTLRELLDVCVDVGDVKAGPKEFGAV